MLYQPPYVLVIALAIALALPAPRRWSPFALARSGSRALARGLPQRGASGIGAGILVLLLTAAPAVALTWALTSALPVALRLVSPDGSPVVALLVAAVVLRLTLQIHPVWAGAGTSLGESPQGRDSHSLQALGIGFAAPIMLFALLGIYAPVVYGTALEVGQGLAGATEAEHIAAPALLVAYLPAYLTRRLVLLFATLAARGRAPELASAVVATLATTALALLVTIW
jgi:hypothetical protein